MGARYTFAVLAAVVWLAGSLAQAEPFPKPNIGSSSPEHIYHCKHSDEAPLIDGNIEEPVWQNAPWTYAFEDIQGFHYPAPAFKTRARMLWDDDFFYIAVEMEEPHLQASFTEHDSYIYQMDNDIEVFIDPDGDTHNYLELELNALNTVWDLLLTRPYRDDGKALHGWDFKGLKTAVALNGTLNDPSDTDIGWTVEIAIPWSSMSEAAGTACPPDIGDYWRVNFSRVQWRFVDEGGHYVKELDPATGEHYPEDNWVWSAPGLISMHYPERWGYVMFVEEQQEWFNDEDIFYHNVASIALYDVYYSQRDYFEQHGVYSADIADLDLRSQGYTTPELPPLITGGGLTYTASIELQNGKILWLDQTGRTWFEPVPEPGEAAK